VQTLHLLALAYFWFFFALLDGARIGRSRMSDPFFTIALAVLVAALVSEAHRPLDVASANGRKSGLIVHFSQGAARVEFEHGKKRQMPNASSCWPSREPRCSMSSGPSKSFQPSNDEPITEGPAYSITVLAERKGAFRTSGGLKHRGRWPLRCAAQDNPTH